MSLHSSEVSNKGKNRLHHNDAQVRKEFNYAVPWTLLLKETKCHNSEVFNLMKNYNCSRCFQYIPIKEDGLRFFPSRRKLRKLHPIQSSPHLFVSKSYKPTKCQELNAKVGNLSLTYALTIFFSH